MTRVMTPEQKVAAAAYHREYRAKNATALKARQVAHYAANRISIRMKQNEQRKKKREELLAAGLGRKTIVKKTPRGRRPVDKAARAQYMRIRRAAYRLANPLKPKRTDAEKAAIAKSGRAAWCPSLYAVCTFTTTCELSQRRIICPRAIVSGLTCHEPHANATRRVA